MLELDLIDYPNDPRTLYYLGYAHYDVFMRNKDEPRPSDWDMLKKAVEYFKRRTEVNGNMEEGWFANAKLGEIHERFYRDWDKARHYYERCIKDDPERADPHFYIGQYYRLRGQHKEAIPFLKKAAMMPIPDRSLFQWHYLYNCLGHVELGRAVLGLGKDDLPAGELKELKTIIADSDCSQGASMGDAQEIKQIVGSLDMRLSSLSGKAGSERVTAAKKVVSLIGKNLNTLEDSLPQDLFNSIVELASRLQDFVAANKGTNPTCRTTRLATTPYLRFLHKHGEEIQDAIDDPTFWASWDALNRVVEVTCR
jgi:tetratricopeptide (TPR) repeat protein